MGLNTGVFIGNGAQHNVIGGNNATPGGHCTGECNLISGNGWDGVAIGDNGTMSNTVSGNYIGTDASGVAALGNTRAGVSINGASQNIIGGHAEGERNIISGNGRWGALLTGPGAMNNVICGNFVGINVSGSVALSNGEDGIRLDTGAQYNVIGGATEDERNLISGNGYKGVFMDGANHNVVIGNYVGTDSTGMARIENASSGVEIFNGSQYNRVGGTTSGERNVISGNATYGVVLNGEFNGAQENSVVGNYIGTNAAGTGPLGNASHGVGIWNGASNNIIGGNVPDERNTIAFNSGHGVGVYSPDSLHNTITRNSIHDNNWMGIGLDDGGNAELTAPAITYFDLVSGVARGTACAGCTVEVFSDSADEGEVYEGSTTADGAGRFTFDKSAPFAGPHLTATATDADGNTSEFSAPAVPPSISHVVPKQGTNDVPNEINVYGLNFAAGISVTLGTTPPTDLATWRLGSTHLRATVPAGLPEGTYDLTVTNPDGGGDTLANAYTVFDFQVENDDLYAQSHDLWCDPPAVRQGEQANLGLVVHRQGGKATLSNVIVRFYDGDPDGGGTSIGDGTIYLLSPRSSASTTRVGWSPAMAGDHAIYARIDPDDTISETIETNNTISTTVTVLPPAGDITPPLVTLFTINDGAETTAVPTVTLTVSAEDNVGGSGMGSMFFVELEFAQAAMQWVPVQASGWLSYTTHYTWTLVPVAGIRYMQAWAADRAGNISLYPYKDRINYLLPSDRVAMGQVKLYRQYVGTGQTLTVIVNPISGDPDLYIWPPTEGAPARVSNDSTGVDQVSIVATASGTYQIEVYGYTAAEYMISINVSGGAARPAAGQQDVQSIHAAKPSRPEPLIPVTNEPLGQMAVPSAPVTGDIHKIYLPLVLKSAS
jgi:hypothetical protein